MKAAAHVPYSGCTLLSSRLCGRPPAPLGPRPRLAVRVQCSATGEVPAALDRSGQDSSLPPSWPTAACRAAAYSSTDRQPAERVPTRVTGRLPEWLNGTYIRNGPGDLQAVEHMFDGYGMLSSFEFDGKANTATGSHR